MTRLIVPAHRISATTCERRTFSWPVLDDTRGWLDLCAEAGWLLMAELSAAGLRAVDAPSFALADDLEHGLLLTATVPVAAVAG